MFGFGMPELIMVAVIVGIIVFGAIIRSRGSSAFGNVSVILLGIGMIAFAASCFKEVPLIGTVFIMPGENILNAKMTDPALRYALFLTGGLFIALGIFLQVRIGFNDPLMENRKSAADDKTANSGGINLKGVKEAKELLDAGAITEDEYNRIKEKFIK